MDFDKRWTKLDGPQGSAVRIKIPTVGASAETVCVWVITAPSYHPAWSQYMLSVVRLRDGIPGVPPPIRAFPGASHELLVAALDPRNGPHTPQRVKRRRFHLPLLRPLNIVEQFEATDDEMLQLAGLCVLGVLFGALPPETADAPVEIRHGWLTSMVKTLAHIRGEVHAK